jgi:hypothetical protein
MKHLYESILDNIDIQMSNGDKWMKEIEKEKKEFLKVIGAAKNYEGGYSLKNGRSNKVFVPNALHEIGFDANYIEIMMYTMDSFTFSDYTDEWTLNIILSKRTDDNMKHICNVLDKTVYMDRWLFNKWNDVVRDLIKPATKSLDTFKKFLDNMEKWNEQLVDTKLLLK